MLADPIPPKRLASALFLYSAKPTVPFAASSHIKTRVSCLGNNQPELVCWSPRPGLNRWPLPYQGSALPLSYVGLSHRAHPMKFVHPSCQTPKTAEGCLLLSKTFNLAQVQKSRCLPGNGNKTTSLQVPSLDAAVFLERETGLEPATLSLEG